MMAAAEKSSFGALDYVLFVLVLVVSAAIGIYHGCRRRQGTVQDFLLGNREMPILPVSLSMPATFMSAVTVLGQYSIHDVMTCR